MSDFRVTETEWFFFFNFILLLISYFSNKKKGKVEKENEKSNDGLIDWWVK